PKMTARSPFGTPPAPPALPASWPSAPTPSHATPGRWHRRPFRDLQPAPSACLPPSTLAAQPGGRGGNGRRSVPLLISPRPPNVPATWAAAIPLAARGGRGGRRRADSDPARTSTEHGCGGEVWFGISALPTAMCGDQQTTPTPSG